MKLLRVLPLLLLGGCYVDTVGYVRTGPPMAPEVYVEERPGQVWIDGRYNWVNSGWVWAPGYYVAERPGYYYAPGVWEHGPRGYAWREGRWNAGRPPVGYGNARGGSVYRAGQRMDGPRTNVPPGHATPPPHGAKPTQPNHGHEHEHDHTH